MSALGSLVVKLALEHAEYVQGLDKSEQAALKFAQNAQKNFDQAANSVQGFLTDTAKNVAGAVVAFTGITSAISNTQNAIDILDGLDKAAQRTGSRVEDLSRVEQATRAVGESFGPVEQAITRLAKGLSSFDDGSNDAFRALEALNVQARDTNGNLRTSAEVFIDVTKALQGYENSANKVAVANALFGKSGAELIPTLNDIADGVDKFSGASALSAQRAGLFNDAMAKTRLLIDNVYNGLAVELLPTLLTIVGAVNSNTNAFGSFQGVGAGVSAVLKGIAIAGFTVVDTFKRLGNEIGGRAAQLAAFASFDFEGAKFIGKSIAEDSARAEAEYDKFVNTILNGDKAIAQTMQNGGLKKTLDFTLQMPAATTKSAAATKQQVSESQRFIDALTKEAGQLGKTTFEIKRMEAARLGVLGTTGAIIDRIENETVAAKKLEEQLSRVRSITESVKTAEERFADTQRELNDLLRLPQGGLSIETYNRALKSAQDELNNTRNVAKNSFNDVSQFAIQAQRNIQDAFSDGLFRAFDGDLKGMVDSFKRAIQQMIAQAISADLLGALFGRSQGLGQTGVLIDAFKNVLSGGSSVGGSAGSASSLLGGITNLGGIFKDGFSSFKNLFTSSGPRGAFTGASFLGLGQSGSALANGVGAGAGGASGLLSGIGGTFAGAGIGISIGSLIGGNKKVGGLSGGLLSTGGAALGAFGGPIGAAIGGILGGAIAGLFGRGPLKQKETNLIGGFSDQGFSGLTSTKFKAEGGLIVGDKVVRIVADTQTGEIISGASGKLQAAAIEAGKLAQEVGRFIQGQWVPIIDGFRQVSKSMGVSSEAIKDFNFQINIASEKGKALTKEQIGEKISEAADGLARTLIPEIDSLRTGAETAAQAFDRLGIEFDGLLSLAISRGEELSEARAKLQNTSATVRTKQFDSFDVKDLGSKASSFIRNFGGADQNNKILTDQISEIIKPFGGSLGDVDTKQELVRIYQSVDLSTDVGRQILKALLDNQDLFLAYADQQTTEFNPGVLLQEAFSNLQLSVSAERERLADGFNKRIKVIDDRIAGLIRSATKLSALSDGLREAASDIRGISNSEARNNIVAAIENAKKGLFPDLSDLQPSLNAIKTLSDSQFSNRSDFERARSSNANLIDQLGELTDTQLDSTNALLENAEDQRNALVDGFEREMFRLDNILSAAQKEIELIMGTNKILLDVSTALKALAGATGAAKGSGKSNPASILGGSGNSGISDSQIRDYISKAKSNDDILQAALANGVSAIQVAKAMNDQNGFTLENIRLFAASRGITGFANGGIHAGGYRIVGERGPELEYTPPSRIHSNSDTKAIFNADGIIESIKMLSNEIKAVAVHSKKTADLLTRTTRDGASMVTTTA